MSVPFRSLTIHPEYHALRRAVCIPLFRDRPSPGLVVFSGSLVDPPKGFSEPPSPGSSGSPSPLGSVRFIRNSRFRRNGFQTRLSLLAPTSLDVTAHPLANRYDPVLPGEAGRPERADRAEGGAIIPNSMYFRFHLFCIVSYLVVLMGTPRCLGAWIR